MKENINDLLQNLNACDKAKIWAKDKTWKEIYHTCCRGDWLLWLFQRTNPNDLQILALAKGYCAQTVLHLMIDQRSKDAVQAAIDFGNGKITIEELNIAADADADAAAKIKNQKETADICRKYLPIKIWNI